MNKTMGKRKAIFLGNGFTRALVKNVPTWGQLNRLILHYLFLDIMLERRIRK